MARHGTGTPARRVRQPTAVAVIYSSNDPADIANAVRVIQAQVRRITQEESCCAYCFIDANGYVFILSEECSALPDWLRPTGHWTDFVACYSLSLGHGPQQEANRRALEAHAAGITEDVIEHLKRG